MAQVSKEVDFRKPSGGGASGLGSATVHATPVEHGDKERNEAYYKS
jgi:hypothetical protein